MFHKHTKSAHYISKMLIWAQKTRKNS